MVITKKIINEAMTHKLYTLNDINQIINIENHKLLNIITSLIQIPSAGLIFFTSTMINYEIQSIINPMSTTMIDINIDTILKEIPICINDFHTYITNINEKYGNDITIFILNLINDENLKRIELEKGNKWPTATLGCIIIYKIYMIVRYIIKNK